MNELTLVIGTTSLLGSALIGGVFFAFSSFVIKALARLPASEGIAAMQSINLVVINPSFLGAFMGTAVLSLVVAGLAVVGWERPAAPLFLGAAICYFAGTFVVTLLGNVPLNNRLAQLSATAADAPEVWEHYRDRWGMWNHVRAAAATAAALLYSLGLIQNGV